MADDGIDLAFNSWQVKIDEARAALEREVNALEDEAAKSSGDEIETKLNDGRVRLGSLYQKVLQLDRRMTALEDFVRVIVGRGSI